VNIKEFNKGYIEKRAVIGTGLGAILGAIKAREGQRLAGSLYGALKGAGADVGALTAGIGGLGGSLAHWYGKEDIPIESIPGRIAKVYEEYPSSLVWPAIAMPLGAAGGSALTGNILDTLYGQKRLKEIFGG
jgi:hypothetical protein